MTVQAPHVCYTHCCMQVLYPLLYYLDNRSVGVMANNMLRLHCREPQESLYLVSFKSNASGSLTSLVFPQDS